MNYHCLHCNVVGPVSIMRAHRNCGRPAPTMRDRLRGVWPIVVGAVLAAIVWAAIWRAV